MDFNGYIQEVCSDLTVKIITAALLGTAVFWKKIRQWSNEWKDCNKQLKLFGKKKALTPWGAKREADKAWAELERRLNAQKDWWNMSKEEREQEFLRMASKSGGIANTNSQNDNN